MGMFSNTSWVAFAVNEEGEPSDEPICEINLSEPDYPSYVCREVMHHEQLGAIFTRYARHMRKNIYLAASSDDPDLILLVNVDAETRIPVNNKRCPAVMLVRIS